MSCYRNGHLETLLPGQMSLGLVLLLIVGIVIFLEPVPKWHERTLCMEVRYFQTFIFVLSRHKGYS